MAKVNDSYLFGGMIICAIFSLLIFWYTAESRKIEDAVTVHLQNELLVKGPPHGYSDEDGHDGVEPLGREGFVKRFVENREQRVAARRKLIVDRHPLIRTVFRVGDFFDTCLTLLSLPNKLCFFLGVGIPLIFVLILLGTLWKYRN